MISWTTCAPAATEKIAEGGWAVRRPRHVSRHRTALYKLVQEGTSVDVFIVLVGQVLGT